MHFFEDFLLFVTKVTRFVTLYIVEAVFDHALTTGHPAFVTCRIWFFALFALFAPELPIFNFGIR